MDMYSEGEEPKKKKESAPGWVNCFLVNNKVKDWHADFRGRITLEDGKSYWVNVYKKTARNGLPYLAVHLMPYEKLSEAVRRLVQDEAAD